ncbi:N(2)-fixation sustaining protein CowN [Trichloromonas sp.]|uniref:N(2)-fixation sustaining protein CowN n=1 Tax=Trichloromonas sp. TaxID=3069249 RepID=UPI003D816280
MPCKKDRYVSYHNIDCEGNSKQLMTMLRRHIDDPDRTNAFWEKFKEKLAQVGKPQENNGRCIDELFLIHTYINNLYEIFEEYEDAEALTLLDQIERECC